MTRYSSSSPKNSYLSVADGRESYVSIVSQLEGGMAFSIDAKICREIRSCDELEPWRTMLVLLQATEENIDIILQKDDDLRSNLSIKSASTSPSRRAFRIFAPATRDRDEEVRI